MELQLNCEAVLIGCRPHDDALNTAMLQVRRGGPWGGRGGAKEGWKGRPLCLDAVEGGRLRGDGSGVMGQEGWLFCTVHPPHACCLQASSSVDVNVYYLDVNNVDVRAGPGGGEGDEEGAGGGGCSGKVGWVGEGERGEGIL